ncbi:hypothetical protein RDWZM_001051 [Blomia tropicalis]|uniref:Uncharacterized protein n=1 Tax=Blomia tropicalis TaxID=40697 RepID=A0A9Q0RR07_BLOTA|nr:MutS protein msh5 [Blomia tropicalis]KAJ6222506.1 hypothetical protein RDWZM_001051 [Blomia tropicalis]
MHSNKTKSYQSQISTMDDITPSEIRQVILSICYKNCKLGISIYRSVFNRLDLIHEIYEYYDFKSLTLIISNIKPTIVLIESKCDENLYKFLKQNATNLLELLKEDKTKNSTITSDNNSFNEDEESDLFSNLESNNEHIIDKFFLLKLSNRLYQYDQCRSKILSLNLPKMSEMFDINERFIFLSSRINFSEINTIKSLGVLLYYLEKNESSFYNFRYQQLMAKVKIIYLNMSNVTIDDLTFETLEIFQQEWHPSTSKKGIYKKEGLSLYGVFNSCFTKMGSFYLKKLFQQPLNEIDILIDRYNTIEYFCNPYNRELKSNLSKCLKKIQDIGPILQRFSTVTSIQFSDIKTFYETLQNIIMLRNYMMTIKKNNLTIFAYFNALLEIELDEIVQCLQNTIDFKKSALTKKVEILSNIDTTLDELKSTFNRLPFVLKNTKSLEEMYISNDQSQTCIDQSLLNNVYIPQLGFLIMIPLVYAQSIQNIEKYGLEMAFCANDMAYYKNDIMRNYDCWFGDIKSDINDRTQLILKEIKNEILNKKQSLKFSMVICAQLDAYIAMSQTAIDNNFVRPKLNCREMMKIVEGRHPLYELVDGTFVANSYQSCLDNSQCEKVMIVYGANHCGKTVYLKQVCLIIYLAHIGSFVPAKYADISIVDQIYTRIRTPESISTQMSAFKNDLNQIIMANKYATQRSLVVIDCFGRGTLRLDGYSLLCSLINNWIESKHCPHLIINWQFNIKPEIRIPSLVGKMLNYFTFEINENKTNSYRLVYGEMDSFANSIQEIGRHSRFSASNHMEQLCHVFPNLFAKYNEYIFLVELVLSVKDNEDLVMLNERIEKKY